MSGSHRKGRGFASRVKGLFGFTPSKQEHGHSDGIDRYSESNVSQTTVEEVSFRKFELPVVKMETVPDGEYSPIRSTAQQQPHSYASPGHNIGGQNSNSHTSSSSSGMASPPNRHGQPDEWQSHSSKVQKWNADTDLEFENSNSNSRSMAESTSVTNFDNSKFRQYNQFGTPSQPRNVSQDNPNSKRLLAETQSMPGFMGGDDDDADDNRNKGYRRESDGKKALPSGVRQTLGLDDLDEDLMDSILAD